MAKRKVIHSRDLALSSSEIKQILASLYGKNKFIFVAFLYGGMRVGELIHMQGTWINRNNNAAKDMGINFIKIPAVGQNCTCPDCLLYHYRDYMRNDEKKPKEWYNKIQKQFYEDKRTGTIPQEVINKSYWSPKSEAGARVIPIIFNKFDGALGHFYPRDDSKTLGITRQQVWTIVKDSGHKILGYDRRLFPHAVRATCATIFASAGINIYDLTTFMGWDSVASANPYMQVDVKRMIESMNKSKENIDEMIARKGR